MVAIFYYCFIGSFPEAFDCHFSLRFSLSTPISWAIVVYSLSYYVTRHMAEADVQFGDGIRPVKTTQSRTFDVENDASLARQGANFDSEERALKITTDDLSRKHKQVC